MILLSPPPHFILSLTLSLQTEHLVTWHQALGRAEKKKYFLSSVAVPMKGKQTGRWTGHGRVGLISSQRVAMA